MRIYAIKRKGAAVWYNIDLRYELKFSDDSRILAGMMFLRKKDAVKYLNTFEHKECFEVVGATIDKKKK